MSASRDPSVATEAVEEEDQEDQDQEVAAVVVVVAGELVIGCMVSTRRGVCVHRPSVPRKRRPDGRRRRLSAHSRLLS